MKLLFTFLMINCCLFFSTSNVEIQLLNEADWVFKKENKGIRIYTREITGSNLKELKITMTFEHTTYDKILNLLKDADAYTEWMFKCSDSRMAGQLSELIHVSYYKFDFPWPLSDRDAYMKSVMKFDADKKNLIVTTTSLPKYGSKEKDVVRIEDHFNQWKFQEKENDRIDLTYFLKSNPGGKIPDWAINMAIDKGPTSSLSKFRQLLSKMR